MGLRFRSSALILILAGSCAAKRSTTSEQKFYGSDSQSAKIQFKTQVDVLIEGAIPTKDAFLIGYKDQIREAVDRQIQHLFGVFTNHDPFVDQPGVIAAQSSGEVEDVEIDGPNMVARVTYSYTDKAVFYKDLLKNGKTTISFVLPKNPKTIYKKGIPKDSFKNKCTDQHYNDEEDFWYFWNPALRGCPLEDSDLVKVSATLTPIKSTTDTYPYYDKILGKGENGDRRVVKVTYMIGIDKNFSGRDYGTRGYKDASKALEEAGFKIVNNAVTPNGPRDQRLFLHKRDYDVEVHMYLADPGDENFARTAGLAMETDDIFIYNGHSGLGGYLSLEVLERGLGRKLALPVNKSQIFFMNGCSTYAYYNDTFFNLKKTKSDPRGRKNLDIVTAAIGAAFALGSRQDVLFITSLTGGGRPKWKLIIDRLYRVDKELSSLVHVNGDEDNPTTARDE